MNALPRFGIHKRYVKGPLSLQERITVRAAYCPLALWEQSRVGRAGTMSGTMNSLLSILYLFSRNILADHLLLILIEFISNAVEIF